MKTLALILAVLAIGFTACGAPFQAQESSALGQAGMPDSAGTGGSRSMVSAAGAMTVSRAGSEAEAGEGEGAAAQAGAAGAAQGGMPATGGASSQGGSGSAGHVGAPAGGMGSVAGTSSAGGGSGGSVVVMPPAPPCAPAVDVSTKTMLDLGTAAACLKTTVDFNYLSCSNWDSRVVKINGTEAPCWTGLAEPHPSDGWNYLEITAGTSEKANLSWSHL